MKIDVSDDHGEETEETLGGETTNAKETVPDRSVIGSLSTWKEEELERTKVRHGVEVDGQSLILEKWFQFHKLERYHAGIILQCQTE